MRPSMRTPWSLGAAPATPADRPPIVAADSRIAPVRRIARAASDEATRDGAELVPAMVSFPLVPRGSSTVADGEVSWLATAEAPAPSPGWSRVAARWRAGLLVAHSGGSAPVFHRTSLHHVPLNCVRTLAGSPRRTASAAAAIAGARVRVKSDARLRQLSGDRALPATVPGVSSGELRWESGADAQRCGGRATHGVRRRRVRSRPLDGRPSGKASREDDPEPEDPFETHTGHPSRDTTASVIDVRPGPRRA